MALKNRDGVEVLKLENLARDEIDEVVYALRYQAAELEEFDRSGKLLQNKTDSEVDKLIARAMSVEEAMTELQQAERDGRLLIEWKRGWMYFFYCPYSTEPDAYFGDTDMREFLTRVSRPTARHRRVNAGATSRA